MTAFMMTPAVAEEFFRRCAEREAVTPKERAGILAELAREGQMISVTETKRSRTQYIKDLVKNFGRVLVVKKKGEEDENVGC